VPLTAVVFHLIHFIHQEFRPNLDSKWNPSRLKPKYHTHKCYIIRQFQVQHVIFSMTTYVSMHT